MSHRPNKHCYMGGAAERGSEASSDTVEVALWHAVWRAGLQGARDARCEPRRANKFTPAQIEVEGERLRQARRALRKERG